jgi:hypothetical protein
MESQCLVDTIYIFHKYLKSFQFPKNIFKIS